LTRGGVVLTVNADRDVVERQLGDGELACPSCGGVLARWGKGAERRVRLPGEPGEEQARHVVLVPRRARCRQCRATHVLLPAWCLARRADAGAKQLLRQRLIDEREPLVREEIQRSLSETEGVPLRRTMPPLGGGMG
jgi:hypothetical protein